MMSTSSLIAEQCISPVLSAYTALESFSASKFRENCSILTDNNGGAGSRIHTGMHLYSLNCIQDEECNNHELSRNHAISVRGGGEGSNFSIDDLHHHPLAFGMTNPSPNLHHSAPFHAAVVASSTKPPFSDEDSLHVSNSDVVLSHDEEGNAPTEMAGTTTIAKNAMRKHHPVGNKPRRRLFRWRFRFRRRQRLLNVNLTDLSRVNSTESLSEQETVIPLRFQRAAKNNAELGRQRYLQTLKWREQYNMDTILSEPHVHFEFIKQHYPHYFHLTGKQGQPVYFEMPPKTNLAALRQGGVTLDILLRHYAMVTEFTWQYVSKDDLQQSIYIIDLESIRPRDFVGECVSFVRQACAFCNQHYPERSGRILVINVPSYFQLIWRVVKKFADKKTLAKVKILRGKDNVLEGLLEFIDMDNIPPEYGGNSMPLGEAPQEKLLWDLMRHNNHVALHGPDDCGGAKGGCPFCTFQLSRKY